MDNKESTERYKDIVWLEKVQEQEILIIGAGGIGSWLALFIARMQPDTLMIYDFDTIDRTNMSGQLYGKNEQGLNKVDALNIFLRNYAGYTAQTYSEFNDNSTILPIVFLATDNMASRKLAYEKWINQSEPVLLVDGRMSVESFEVYIVTPERKSEYEATLFTDEEASDPVCSMKATSHCGATIASFMTAAFTNVMTNLKYNNSIREVPFQVNFQMELFNMESINSKIEPVYNENITQISDSEKKEEKDFIDIDWHIENKFVSITDKTIQSSDHIIAQAMASGQIPVRENNDVDFIEVPIREEVNNESTIEEIESE